MFDASVSRFHRPALLIDKPFLDHLLRIASEFQRASRLAYLAKNNLSEAALRELETNKRKPDLSIREQVRADEVLREVARIQSLTARIELESGVTISDVAPQDIEVHSGIDLKAIKSLTIFSGSHGVSRLNVQLSNNELFSANWQLTSAIEIVERADTQLQELMRQSKPLWSPMNTWWMAFALSFFPVVVAAAAFSLSALVSWLSDPTTSFRAALAAATSFLSRYRDLFGPSLFFWVIGSWFLGKRGWSLWQKVFPRGDFRLGRNAERSLSLAKFRLGIASAVFATLVAPFVGPSLLGALQTR